jgi:hypothetical protein
MKMSRPFLPFLAGLIVAAGLSAPAPAPAQGRSNYSKTMEDMTGYNSHKEYGKDTLGSLKGMLPIAGAAVGGLIVLVVVIAVVLRKPKDPKDAALSDPWVQAQMRRNKA